MSCLEKELVWKMHSNLLKKFRREEAALEDVLASAKNLPVRCSKEQWDAETRGRKSAISELQELQDSTPLAVK